MAEKLLDAELVNCLNHGISTDTHNLSAPHRGLAIELTAPLCNGPRLCPSGTSRSTYTLRRYVPDTLVSSELNRRRIEIRQRPVRVVISLISCSHLSKNKKANRTAGGSESTCHL